MTKKIGKALRKIANEGTPEEIAGFNDSAGRVDPSAG